ncbi:hypothetical protein ACFS2C_02885 [Prauserella oleivorans]|uniref:Uncharacterized protein n=1 Tax=Prauserella oleivorans TaxID=1478153 RepID=A0ABW5W537_9PSEU
MSATESTGPTGSQGQPGMSEDEAREYVSRLRTAPVEQLVSEVVFSLLNAAQVKLGRRDARLLIDLGGLVAGHSREYVSAELAQQVDRALAQLRLGQVSAESEVAGKAEPEPNDLDRTPAPPSSTAAPGASPTAASGATAAPEPKEPSAASRLWVPGR